MVGEMSGRGSLRRGNVQSGNCLVGEISVGEVSIGEVSSEKCQLGNCPVGKLSDNPRTRTSEKGDPKTLEKTDPISKLSVWVKDSLMTNLRVLISNMTTVS